MNNKNKKNKFKFYFLKFKKYLKSYKSRIKSNFQIFFSKLKTKYNYTIFKIKKSKLYQKGINWLIWPYLLIMILLIIIPLFIIFLFSLIQPTGNNLIFEFNLSNFIYFFSEKSIIISLFLSLFYAFISSIISIIIAFPVAYIMAFCKSKLFKKNIWILVTLPIWINMLLKIIGLQTLFNLIAPNLLGTYVSIIIGMVYAFLPFVILPIYNSLDKIDNSLIEASRDLGAGFFKTFWKIIFRYSIPGIISGATMLFVQSVTSLIIIKFMGNGQFSMIVEIIESYFFKGGNFGMGAAISIILAIIILIVIIVTNWFSKQFEHKKRGKKYEKIS